MSHLPPVAGDASERLQLALAAAQLGDWSWSAADDGVTLSPRAAEIFGVRAGSSLTWSRMRGILHEDDREHARIAVERALEARIDYDIEYRVLRADGERWINAKGRGVYDGASVLGMIGIVQDVTERKRVEERLRSREELLRATFVQAAVGIALIDIGTRILETNTRFAEILGYTPAELRGMSSTQFTHPDHVGEANEDVRRLVAGEISEYARERRYVCKDGRVLWLLAKVTLLRDPAGTPWRFISVIQDITERRDAEEALRRSEDELRVLNTTGRAIGSKLDLETIVQTVTDAATHISGAKFGAFFYNVVNAQGEAFQLYTLSGAPREAFEKFGLPRNTPVFKPTFVGEGIVRSPDITKDPRYGTMAPHYGMPKGHLPVRSYLAVPVLARSGEVIGGLFFGHPEPGVFTGRAERLVAGIAAQAAVALDNARLYEAAQRSAAEAKRMSELKDEFLATLSHELRTPLSAILGWTQVLRARPAQGEELQRALETIERNARMQARLVEDLLDMSRITSGKLRLDVQPVDPVSFIEAAVATVLPAAQAKSVRLDKVLATTTGPVAGDAARLQQVVWNLLSNAVKFTPGGGRVQVLLQKAGSHAEISVRDSGVGIEPGFLGHIFERFRQADASTTRRHGGLGLGLSIVRHLVELHGGTVSVYSEGANRGATFTVRLPLAAVPRVQQAVPETPARDYRIADLSGVRFLVVDDEPDARALVEQVLRDCGGQVDGAASAAEAMRRLAAAPPHVLVCDIGMPGTDGYELIRQVRADGSLARIPAIALTAFASSEDRTRALRAGFQHHLAKPVEPAELVATAASIAARGPA